MGYTTLVCVYLSAMIGDAKCWDMDILMLQE